MFTVHLTTNIKTYRIFKKEPMKNSNQGKDYTWILHVFIVLLSLKLLARLSGSRFDPSVALMAETQLSALLFFLLGLFLLFLETAAIILNRVFQLAGMFLIATMFAAGVFNALIVLATVFPSEILTNFVSGSGAKTVLISGCVLSLVLLAVRSKHKILIDDLFL